VKVDGIMGTKSMAALEAMKQTQISLGFTDKDVDGIRGIKTTAAINARDKEVSAQIMALKNQLLLIDLWTYKNCSSRAI
jgi:lysozyme family protein